MLNIIHQQEKHNLEDRFWSKVDCDSDDQCWEWQACRDSNGYGRFSIHNTNVWAHRVSYLLECGEIPANKEIHHKCENPSCVNPHHLTLLSTTEHNYISDGFGGINHRKTHCPKGHEYNEENTRVDKHEQRHCRICHKIQENARYHKRKKHGVKELEK